MNPRPLKLRRGARVLLLAGEEVLLLNDSDPGIPGSSWWVTPGGGIDAGENPAEAACREAGEETGLQLTPLDLVGPVARGRACHATPIASGCRTIFSSSHGCDVSSRAAWVGQTPRRNA